jgi:hypothetical protein
VLHNFYDGLTPMSRGHIDAATGGAFFPHHRCSCNRTD